MNKKFFARLMAAPVLGLAISVQSQAFGLGKLQLHSALNEPFRAKIDLTALKANEQGNIQIRLADDDEFKKAGIERNFLLSSLKFKVIYDGANSHILVSSEQAVKEPFLDFLLTATTGKGRLIREYTVLLDPPKTVFGSPTVATQTHRHRALTTTAHRRKATHTALGRSKFTGNRYGPTTHTDTLWDIALKTLPRHNVTVSQMMMALLKANPKAFQHNNINGLKAGYTLSVPTLSEIKSLTAEQAQAASRKQNKLWKNYSKQYVAPTVRKAIPVSTASGTKIKSQQAKGAEDSHLELVASANNKTARTVRDESVSTKEDARLKKLSERLTVAQETIEAQTQENIDFKERMDSMEKQLKTMRRLILLKDKGLARLQNMLQKQQAGSETSPDAAVESPAAPPSANAEQAFADDSATTPAPADAEQASADNSATTPAPANAEQAFADDSATTPAPADAEQASADDSATTPAPADAEQASADDSATTPAPADAEQASADDSATMPAPADAEQASADDSATMPAPADAEQASADNSATMPAPADAEQASADNSATMPAPADAEQASADNSATTPAPADAEQASADNSATMPAPADAEQASADDSAVTTAPADATTSVAPNDPGIKTGSTLSMATMLAGQVNTFEDLNAPAKVTAPATDPRESQSVIAKIKRFMMRNQLQMGLGSLLTLFLLWLMRRRRKPLGSGNEMVEAEDVKLYDQHKINAESPVEAEDVKPYDQHKINVESPVAETFDESANDNNDHAAPVIKGKSVTELVEQADMFVGYSDYVQAHSALEQAHRIEPDNLKVAQKLLFVLYKQYQPEAFAALAGMAAFDHDSDDWAKISEWGRDLTPANDLFAVAEQQQAGEVKVAEPLLDHTELDLGQTVSDFGDTELGQTATNGSVDTIVDAMDKADHTEFDLGQTVSELGDTELGQTATNGSVDTIVGAMDKADHTEFDLGQTVSDFGDTELEQTATNGSVDTIVYAMGKADHIEFEPDYPKVKVADSDEAEQQISSAKDDELLAFDSSVTGDNDAAPTKEQRVTDKAEEDNSEHALRFDSEPVAVAANDAKSLMVSDDELLAFDSSVTGDNDAAPTKEQRVTDKAEEDNSEHALRFDSEPVAVAANDAKSLMVSDDELLAFDSSVTGDNDAAPTKEQRVTDKAEEDNSEHALHFDSEPVAVAAANEAKSLMTSDDELAQANKVLTAENDSSVNFDNVESNPNLEFDIDDIEDIDEAETKLDLAAAYVDIGDPEGAKSILEEVLRDDSTDEQKSRAKTLISGLS